MSRPIGKSILLCVFLCAQLVAAIHAAEYGSAFHTHGDHPCTIQLLNEAGKGASPAPLLLIAVPAPIRSSTYPCDSQLSEFVSPNAFFIRAPPFSSFV